MKKYNRGSIYLSGGMEHAADLGAAWRKTVSKQLKAMGYFPIDVTELDKAYTEKYGHLYKEFPEDELLQKKSNIRTHFVHTDLALILNLSDALVVYYDQSARLGAGTISECQVSYNNDIPVFVVSYYEDWFKEVPGWLQALSTKIFSSFEDLYVYLDKLPKGILHRDIYGNHHAGSHYLCSMCGEPFVKNKTHFVSKVTPLYCSGCVELVKTTNEKHANRYNFFVDYLKERKCPT